MEEIKSIISTMSLPKTITSEDEFYDYLELVFEFFMKRRKVYKPMRLLNKVLFSIVGFVCLLLSIDSSITVIVAIPCFWFAIKYPVNPAQLTIDERSNIKTLQLQYKLANKNKIDISKFIEQKNNELLKMFKPVQKKKLKLAEKPKDINKIIQKQKRREFRLTRTLGRAFSRGLLLNENTKQFRIIGNPHVLEFSDIIDCELIEDGYFIITTNALPKAVVGGALFGEVGSHYRWNYSKANSERLL